MEYTISKIQRAFGHKLIGTKFMKRVVCQTLLFLPPKIIDYVTRHCWFVGSFDDGWGFTLRGQELGKSECLIFLSDELLNQGIEQIRYTIIHEVGHVVLGHKNSILEIQGRLEVKRQEKEADTFARLYLGK